MDFPVAFVTNILYVCAKNDISHLINTEAFIEIILQKQNFMHLEGISHTAYALDKLGIYDEEIWGAL